MVFTRYFFKCYIIYFFTLTAFLALLFNVVEFVEKTMSSSSVGIAGVAYFSYLNFFATVADFLPIGAWLASFLVIREFIQNDEWDAIALLSIGPSGLLRNFLLVSSLVMVVGAGVDEFWLRSMSLRAEQYRLVTFKKKRTDLVSNGWYKLSDHLFCTVGEFSCQTSCGKELRLFKMAEDFSLQEVIIADEFSCDNSHHSLNIVIGTKLTVNQGVSETDMKGKCIHLPRFFGQLYLQTNQFSLIEFVKYYAFDNTFLLLGVNKELWALFWERIFFYLQIVLFSIFPLLLFILFEAFGSIRWVAALSPYPLYTAFVIVIRHFLQENLYFYAMIGLYGVVLICLLLFYRKYYIHRRTYPLANF